MNHRESADLASADAVLAALEPYTSPPPLFVIVSGPSGAGKDSAIRRMREMHYPFHFVVTATSRAPRPEERHGHDYYFVSRREFERMMAAGELLEYAVVYEQYKGVPKAQIQQALASGMDVVLRLDVQGAATVRRLVPQALTIFVTPSSLDALMSRLHDRGADSPEQMQTRIDTALAELGRIQEFDYVVINDNGQLDAAVRRIAAIIAAEKCRTGRQRVVL